MRRAIRLQGEGRHLLLSGDPVAMGDVPAAPSAPALEAIACCLLDVQPRPQALRLARRGDPAEFLVRHQAFAASMRGHMSEVIKTGA